MALQRNSPLKRKFDLVIGWMLNGGFVRQFFLDALRISRTQKARVRFKTIKIYQAEMGIEK